MRKLYKSLSRRAFTFFNYKDKWHASVARINIFKGNKVKWSNFSVTKLLTFQRLSVFSSASAVPVQCLATFNLTLQSNIKIVRYDVARNKWGPNRRIYSNKHLIGKLCSSLRAASPLFSSLHLDSEIEYKQIIDGEIDALPDLYLCISLNIKYQIIWERSKTMDYPLGWWCIHSWTRNGRLYRSPCHRRTGSARAWSQCCILQHELSEDLRV